MKLLFILFVLLWINNSQVFMLDSESLYYMLAIRNSIELPVPILKDSILSSFRVIKHDDQNNFIIVISYRIEGKGVRPIEKSEIKHCLLNMTKITGCKQIKLVNPLYVAPDLAIVNNGNNSILLYCDYHKVNSTHQCDWIKFQYAGSYTETYNTTLLREVKSRSNSWGFSVALHKSDFGIDALIGFPRYTGISGSSTLIKNCLASKHYEFINSDTGYLGYSVNFIYNQYLVTVPSIMHSYFRIGNMKFYDPDEQQFNYFGHSAISLKLTSIYRAVVVTAPYYSGTFANQGKIYLYCNIHGRYKLYDSLIGTEKDEYMGLDILDVSDDRQEIAILSSYMRKEKSKIAIYHVLQNCKFQRKPKTTIHVDHFDKHIIKMDKFDANSDEKIDLIVGTRHSKFTIYLQRTYQSIMCHFKDKYTDLSMGETYTWTFEVTGKALEFIPANVLEPELDLNYGVDRKYMEIKKIIMKDTIPAKISFTFKVTKFYAKFDLNNEMKGRLSYKYKCNNSTKCNIEYPIIKPCVFTYNVCAYCPDVDLKVVMKDIKGTLVSYGDTHDEQRVVYVNITVDKRDKTRSFNVTVITDDFWKIVKVKCQTCSTSKLSGDRITNISVRHNFFFKDKVYIQIALSYIGKVTYNHSNSSLSAIVRSNTDPNLSNNIAKLNYRFKFNPNISIVSSNSPIHQEKMNRPERNKHRLSVSTIGPAFKQEFEIRNRGTTMLRNFKIILTFPSYLKSRDEPIIYLFESVRDSVTLERIKTKPTVTIGGQEVICDFGKSSFNPKEYAAIIKNVRINNTNYSRVKREAKEDDELYQFSTAKMDRIPIEPIKCNRRGLKLPEPNCFQMVCNVKKLIINEKAMVKVHGWLFAETFFRYRIADSKIYMNLKVVYQAPEGVIVDDNHKELEVFKRYIFHKVRHVLSHHTQIWPTVVGVSVGLLLLAVIIVAMYKCDFFKVPQRDPNDLLLRTQMNSTDTDPYPYLISNNPTIVHQYDAE